MSVCPDIRQALMYLETIQVFLIFIKNITIQKPILSRGANLFRTRRNKNSKEQFLMAILRSKYIYVRKFI